MKRAAIALAAGLAVIPSAGALAAPEAEPDSAPDWVKKPTPAELFAVYPTEAMKRGRSGKALIGCDVTIEGALRNCEVVSESPSGAGFGAAAVALTPQLLMKPAMRDGRPVEAKIRLPINFTAFGSGVPPGSRTVLSNLSWSQAPTVTDLREAHPKEAQAKKLTGHATLACEFGVEGGLRKCTVITETPKGVGFRAAALNLSKKFVGPTRLPDGRSTQAMMVQVPITFALATLEERPRIGRPQWEVLPTPESLLRGAPQVERDVTVTVLMDCGVAGAGKLEDCRVESESPAGGSFGESALRMTSVMKVAVWTDEGLPTVGGRVRVPFRYNLKAASTETPAP